jgi:hypothetical protein
MAKKVLYYGILLFSIMIIGCDNGTTSGENDIWLKVTNISQVDGTWKAPSAFTANIEGIKVTGNSSNYIITFNSITNTMTVSGTVTATCSGGNINTLWPDLKEGLEYMNQQEGVTIIINDINHSYTITYNDFSQTLPNDIISYLDFQINQYGTKMKFATNGIEIIYTKQ